MAGPFKMKGSPFQRNFGIGSPLHEEGHFLEKKKTIPMEEHKGGDPNYELTLPKSNQGSEGVKTNLKEIGKDYTLPKSNQGSEGVKGVTKGDVVQTLLAPNVNIKKTIGVVKHYTPPKVKKTVKNVINKGKEIVKKGKDWLKSPA